MNRPFVFHSRSTLMTPEGLKCANKINTNDLVMTKEGFVKAERTKSSLASLVKLRGHGHPRLMLLENQDVFATDYKRISNKETGKSEREFSNPRWINAKSLKGMFWASPSLFKETKAPIDLNKDIAWIIGAYLSKGYVNYNTTTFNVNHFREEELKNATSNLGLRLIKKKKGSIYEYEIHHAVLANWLKMNFETMHFNKNIPFWIYGMDYIHRKEFFNGFIWGVGIYENKSYRFSIKNNKCLAIGMKLISQTLGYSTALYLSTSKKGSRKTERWQIVAEENARSSVDIDNKRYGLIRSVTKEKEPYIVQEIELGKSNIILVDGIIIKV